MLHDGNEGPGPYWSEIWAENAPIADIFLRRKKDGESAQQAASVASDNAFRRTASRSVGSVGECMYSVRRRGGEGTCICVLILALL